MMFKVCILAVVIACAYGFPEPSEGDNQLTDEQKVHLDTLKGRFCAATEPDTRVDILDKINAILGKPSFAELRQKAAEFDHEAPSLQDIVDKMCSTDSE